MNDLQTLFEVSSRDHGHLCPRQILGVRIGLLGIRSLQLGPNCGTKSLFVIAETDGCFSDGISAATNCSIGHRTLRVEDYGKIAATFVDTLTAKAIRVSPALDVRERACIYDPDESRHYFAQMQAYKIMPDDEMLTVRNVVLKTPVEQIVSRAGVRANCDICGEEIINEREILRDGMVLCHPCAEGGYYQFSADFAFKFDHMPLVDRGGEAR